MLSGRSFTLLAIMAWASLVVSGPAPTAQPLPQDFSSGGLCGLLCPCTGYTTTVTRTAAPGPPATSVVTTTVTSVVTATPTGECPVPSKLKPLRCVSDAYLIQFKTLLSVNLRNGDRQVIANGVGGKGPDINSIGFNPLDSYLYGLQGQDLLRIGADGATEVVVKLPAGGNIGDVDINGQYYYSDRGRAWGQVDLMPGSPKYGRLVAEGQSDPKDFLGLADWAFTPAAPGFAYSISVNKGVPAIVRWSTTSHQWESVYNQYGDKDFKATNFGAVMATSDGIVYASDNASGQIFRFPLALPATAAKAGLGPKASSNDGARCALLPDITV